MEEQTYKIENVKSFEPVHIFDCGQCFRWDKELDGSYTGVFKGNVMNVKKDGNNVTFKGICNGDIEEICRDYFDLNTDYEDIKEKLSKIDDNVKTSVGYGSGIRILNQDLWETIISFIISANNNIPRIKGIIDRISKKYGKEVNWNGTKYYTFPTVEELSKASVEDLRALGLGFRDVRVYETTKKILNKEAFDKKGLVYGMGHAVYSVSDPRAEVFKRFVEQLAEEKHRQKDFKLYSMIERLAPEVIGEERHIYKGVSANVDFYSGLLYSLLDIPCELYTPLFATARITGWSAHRLEELINCGKIIRPAYMSISENKEYVDLKDR